MVWRYIPTGASPLDFGYILSAAGRWNRPGKYGALYLGASEQAARAEYVKYQVAAGFPPPAPGSPPIHELVSVDLEITSSVLDLTNPGVLNYFGIQRDDLRAAPPNGFKICRQLADLARALGYYILFVPSAPLGNATNIVIFSDVPPSSCHLRDGGVRLPLP